MLLLSRHGAVTRPIAARLAPALAALATALLLGAFGPARAGAWLALESPEPMAVTGLLLAGAAGLFACHLALLTARPAPSHVASALPAALIAGALPGLGAAALFVPLCICGYATLRARLRPAALLGLFGALTGIGGAWFDDPIFGTMASLVMLAAAALPLIRSPRAALNDNRPPEALGEFWILPDDDTHPVRASSPGLGE
jgi:hypothetical protein